MPDEVAWGLMRGVIFLGVVYFKRPFPVIRSPVCEEDIIVETRKNLNRALPGDIVAFIICTNVSGAEEAHLSRFRSANIDLDDPELIPGRGLCGAVVAIIKHDPRHSVVGTFDFIPVASGSAGSRRFISRLTKDSRHYVFRPLNPILPTFAVSTMETVPRRSSFYRVSHMFWPLTSAAPIARLNNSELDDDISFFDALTGQLDFPSPRLTRSEVRSIIHLADIINEAHKNRDIVDGDSCFVVSIDPKGSQDRDDALSIEVRPDGALHLGVHIADVTAFIRKNTVLDARIRRQATTLYLLGHEQPLLPWELAYVDCSLTKDEERLAVSVFWDMDAEGRVVSDVTFARTIVKLTDSLTYAGADECIKKREEERESTGCAMDPRNPGDLLIRLRDIAWRLRAERARWMAIAPPPFDCEESFPDDYISVALGRERQSQVITQEMMVLCNYFVAIHLCRLYPLVCPLRVSLPPSMTLFRSLVGMPDASPQQITAVMMDCMEELNVAHPALVVSRVIQYNALHGARYIISSQGKAPEQLFNWGTGTFVYTHFTSPIRRFQDQIVHRLLLLAMSKGEDHIEIAGPVSPYCEAVQSVCLFNFPLARAFFEEHATTSPESLRDCLTRERLHDSRYRRNDGEIVIDRNRVSPLVMQWLNSSHEERMAWSQRQSVMVDPAVQAQVDDLAAIGFTVPELRAQLDAINQRDIAARTVAAQAREIHFCRFFAAIAAGLLVREELLPKPMKCGGGAEFLFKAVVVSVTMRGVVHLLIPELNLNVQLDLVRCLYRAKNAPEKPPYVPFSYMEYGVFPYPNDEFGFVINGIQEEGRFICQGVTIHNIDLGRRPLSRRAMEFIAPQQRLFLYVNDGTLKRFNEIRQKKEDMGEELIEEITEDAVSLLAGVTSMAVHQDTPEDQELYKEWDYGVEWEDGPGLLPSVATDSTLSERMTIIRQLIQEEIDVVPSEQISTLTLAVLGAVDVLVSVQVDFLTGIPYLSTRLKPKEGLLPYDDPLDISMAKSLIEGCPILSIDSDKPRRAERERDNK